jgi:hypothetical protein
MRLLEVQLRGGSNPDIIGKKNQTQLFSFEPVSEYLVATPSSPSSPMFGKGIRLPKERARVEG